MYIHPLVFGLLGSRFAPTSVRMSLDMTLTTTSIVLASVPWSNIQSTSVKWSIDDARDIFTLEVDKEPSTSGASSSANPANSSGREQGRVRKEMNRTPRLNRSQQRMNLSRFSCRPTIVNLWTSLFCRTCNTMGTRSRRGRLQAQRDARKKFQAGGAVSHPKTEDARH